MENFVSTEQTEMHNRLTTRRVSYREIAQNVLAVLAEGGDLYFPYDAPYYYLRTAQELSCHRSGFAVSWRAINHLCDQACIALSDDRHTGYDGVYVLKKKGKALAG
jgi:hypothetical protein